MLNRCEIPEFKMDFPVVSFKAAFSLPLETIVELSRKSEKRLRLMTLYREHMAQAFGRFIMRVGA